VCFFGLETGAILPAEHALAKLRRKILKNRLVCATVAVTMRYQKPPRQPARQPTRRISRREFLAVTALSASACAGMCTVGGLAGLLLARRAHIALLPTEQPIPTAAPTSTTDPAPPIVNRDSWGARATNHDALNEKGFASASNPLGWQAYEGDLSQIYRTVAIHHSHPVRQNGTMLDIQKLHLDYNKWADIAYHYGVDLKGTIYAGRDIHVRGASVAGYNTGTIGVVAIGDFQWDIPTEAQLESLQALVLWLTRTYHLTHLAGHYEFNNDTVCPGPNLRPRLDALAQAAGLQRGTGGYVGPTPFANTQSSAPKGCC
jgi:hypothetical protein